MVVDLQLNPREKIVRAICDLQKDQPFFAHLAMNMKIKEMPEDHPMKTMAVDAKGNMFYADEFVAQLTQAQTKGVVTHEVMHCLEPGTVVTNKLIENISSTDSVICSDGESHKVLRHASRKFKGEIISIKPRGCLSFKITPNHRILTVKMLGWKTEQLKPGRAKGARRNVRMISKPEWVEAGDLTTNHYVLVPKLKADNFFKDFKLPMSDGIEGNEWSVRAKDCLLDEDVAFVLGRFTADGWTDKNENSCTVGFCFNIRKEADMDRTVDVLKNKFGVTSRKVFDKQENGEVENPEGIWRVFAGTLVFKRFLRKHIGTYSHNKIIPKWIMQHPDINVVRGYLKGLLGGDGWLNDRGGANDMIGYCTVNKILAVQVQSLLTRLNSFGRMYEREGGTCGISVNPEKENRRQYLVLNADKVLFEILGFEYVKSRSTKWFMDIGDSFAVNITGVCREVYGGEVYNFSTGIENYAANNVVVHNCALEHMLRTGARDHKISNVAQDVAVNMMIKQSGMELPEVWKVKTKDGKTVDGKGIPADVAMDNSVFELHGYAPKPIKIRIEQVSLKPWESIYSEVLEQITKQQQQQGGQQQGGQGLGQGQGSNQPGFDEHMHGKDGETGEELSGQEMEAEANRWRGNLANAAQYSKNMGKVPAGLDRILKDILKPKVRWKELLLRYIKQHGAPVDWSYHKPSKRSHALGIFMPTVVRESVDVEIIVDVSGSIDGDSLKEFISEVVGIAKALSNINMQVTFVDAEIHESYAVSNGDIPKILNFKISGGGGTNLEIKLEHIKETNPSIPLVILLTDGFTPFTHKRSDFPFDCLWCITKNGINDLKEIPYGYAIKMDG